MVTFKEIPESNRSPLVAAEFDPIGAPGMEQSHILVIGVQLSGTVSPLTPTLVTGETEGDGLFGAGSMLARMLRAVKRVNRSARVTAIGVEEPSTGAAASGKLAVSGSATADGELAVYIGGERVAVGVSSGDTADDIAAALEAAIDADDQLPVTAAVSGAEVTVTCRWKGSVGNDIHLGVALRDTDEMPAGVSVSITPMAGGTGAPDLSAVVAVLEETIYSHIVSGFNDATSLATLEAEVERRWEADVALDGHVFAAVRGNVASMVSAGQARNSAASTLFGAGLSPTPSWIWAAQVAARDAGVADPGLPRFGLTLPDCLPPAPADRLDHAERNVLLHSGISTHRVDSGGRAIIDRLITTWQRNALGEPDTTWLALTTRHTAAYLRRDWVRRISAKYSGYKLADDGTQVGPGARVITPSVIEAEALAWFREKEREGHVEDFDAFRASLVAERNASDPTRLDALLAPNIVNELVTIATKVAFSV